MPTRKNRKNPKKRKKTKRGGGAPVNKSPKPFPLSKQPSLPSPPETESLPVIYESPEGIIFMQNPFVNDNSSLILDPDITIDYQGETYSLWRVNTDEQTVYALLEPYHTTLLWAQLLVDQGARMIYKLEGEIGEVEMDQGEIESYLYGH
uniref:Uncharacterized protein n=1 Tax=viral metagenome TaxID=1070528 RepID=A0A6C0HNG4_9ZZZZ